MSDKTVGILNCKLDIKKLTSYLQTQYEDVQVEYIYNSKICKCKFIYINFKDKRVKRILRTIIYNKPIRRTATNIKPLKNYGCNIKCKTRLTFEWWENSIATMQGILQRFGGGYMQDSDYYNEKYYKVQTIKERTERQKECYVALQTKTGRNCCMVV